MLGVPLDDPSTLVLLQVSLLAERAFKASKWPSKRQSRERSSFVPRHIKSDEWLLWKSTSPSVYILTTVLLTRYVYKLCDLHLSVENYTEAAFTLLRRADDLQVREHFTLWKWRTHEFLRTRACSNVSIVTFISLMADLIRPVSNVVLLSWRTQLVDLN